MKKTLLSLLSVLSILSLTTLASCGSDDDDSTPDMSAETINDVELKSGSTYELGKGTIVPSETGSDTVKLNLTCKTEKIKRVEISVSNDYEDKVSVSDILGVCHNDKYAETSEPTSKIIRFIGVYGEYTVKVVTSNGSKSYKFTLTNKSGNQTYKSGTRMLCNKQIIYFDASGTQYSASALGLTYKVNNDEDTKNFSVKKIAKIEKSKFDEISGYMLTDFNSEAAKSTFVNLNLSMDNPYLIYQYSSTKYYLIHLLSIDGNILKAEVQY